MICADHNIHDGHCGICALARLSQITPAETYDLTADVTRLRLLHSIRIPTFDKSITLPFLQPLTKAPKVFPSDLEAWEPWSQVLITIDPLQTTPQDSEDSGCGPQTIPTSVQPDASDAASSDSSA